MLLFVVASLLLSVVVFSATTRLLRPKPPAPPPKLPPPKPPSRLPPPKPYQPFQEKRLVYGEPPAVYKDDVDLTQTVKTVESMARRLGLDDEQREAMVSALKSQVKAMPSKPPEKNDVCPECGKMFAMIDDYICPECRSER